MIEEFRYDDGKMHERQLCMLCCIKNGIPIQRSTYEFCHDFVTGNQFEGYIPTEEDPLEEKLKDFNGDYLALAASRVTEVWKRWHTL